MQLENSKHYFIVLLSLVLINSCNPARSQSRRQSLPGTEVLPGSPLIDASFFKPFTAKGRIDEVKGDKRSPFRYMKKEMRWIEEDGQKLIEQVLTYTDPKSEAVTGIHRTHYDPASLQVVYWEYGKGKGKAQFAFKAEGTTISGTQQPQLENAQWRTTDIGLGLFQNESRELLFRSLSKAPIGTEVKFPIIGMQAPFHGWVAYKYSKNKEVEFEGKMHTARVWEASGNPNSYYLVIDQAPYVINRNLPTGGDSGHVFRYESVSDL